MLSKLISKFMEKYSQNTPTHLLAKKLDFKKDIRFYYSPIETSVILGKRLLKPIDIFSTIIYLINKGTLLVDNSKIKRNSSSIILIENITNKENSLSNHEKFILEYLKSFSDTKTEIDTEKIKSFFIEKNAQTKQTLKKFFNDLDLIVENDLIDKELIVKAFPKNKIAFISISILFLLLFRSDFRLLQENFTINPSSLILNLLILFLLSGFTLNYLYSKANVKLNPNIKKNLPKSKILKSKFFLFKRIIGQDFEISFKNSMFFTSHWFSLDYLYDTNYGFFKDLLFSFKLGTIKSRETSKRLFIKFSNMVSNLSKNEAPEKTYPTIFNRKYILTTSNDIDQEPKGPLESFLLKRLNVNEKIEANNLVIFRIFEFVVCMEKSYFR